MLSPGGLAALAQQGGCHPLLLESLDVRFLDTVLNATTQQLRSRDCPGDLRIRLRGKSNLLRLDAAYGADRSAEHRAGCIIGFEDASRY